MNEEPSESGHRSWLERLSFTLSGEPKDKEELVEVLREAKRRELLNNDALSMIEGVIGVSEMQVRDVMLPRGQMVVVRRDWSLDQLLTTVIESGHSRLPVIGENRDDILGILIVKDLLRYFAQNNGAFDLQAFLRPAKFIPESKRVDVLLKEFQASRSHMAIIVDEYGGVAGLVTIEDLLEQIVGDIDDEHDIDMSGKLICPQGEKTFAIQAITSIEEFNEHFATHFDDEQADTIGGLIMMKLGRLPKRGELVVLDGFRFRVLRADNRCIQLLELTLPEEETVHPVSA
jgi:magnesium and cobalt transporter